MREEPTMDCRKVGPSSFHWIARSSTVDPANWQTWIADVQERKARGDILRPVARAENRPERCSEYLNRNQSNSFRFGGGRVVDPHYINDSMIS